MDEFKYQILRKNIAKNPMHYELEEFNDIITTMNIEQLEAIRLAMTSGKHSVEVARHVIALSIEVFKHKEYS